MNRIKKFNESRQFLINPIYPVNPVKKIKKCIRVYNAAVVRG